MEKRFMLFYRIKGAFDLEWFKSEEEMRIFLSVYDPDEILVVKAMEILDSREIELTD